MKKLRIVFYECEHNGDLNNYKDDLRASGADILDSDIDYEEETGEVVIEVSDVNAFKQAFQETESFGFSSLL